MRRPALSEPGAFVFEQLTFAIDAPAVAGKRTAGSDDAMARDKNGHTVGSAGTGHGACRCGIADLRGKLAVAARLPCGDLLQCVPDAKLEGSAAQVEGQALSGAFSSYLPEN